MSIRRKKRIIIILAVLLLAGGGVAAYLLLKDKVSPPAPRHSQLTGNEVPDDIADRPILGIMLENSLESRPQTGLDSAGMVFETVTEGGITRYLALYQENMPKEVGPVRSLRPYFVDTITGLDVSVAHVGGSAEALQMVEQRKAKSLSQFKYTGPYYRVNFRLAPHNMYASTEKLRKLQEELDHKKSQFPEFPRSNDYPSQNPTATKIVIDFSGPLYEAEFRYDKPTNTYHRYLAGEPHIDAVTKKPITVKNVIVIKIPNPRLGAQGKGEAFVFKDGGVQKVRWKKDSYNQRIKIIDEQGKEVSLNRGDSWFAIIPSAKTLKY